MAEQDQQGEGGVRGQQHLPGHDYFLHVAVADAEAFEAFQMGKLIGLPAVSRAVSHQTMKRLKG